MDKSLQIPFRSNFFNMNHRAKIRFYEIQRPKKMQSKDFFSFFEKNGESKNNN